MLSNDFDHPSDEFGMAVYVEDVAWHAVARIVGHEWFAPEAQQTLLAAIPVDVRDDRRNATGNRGPVYLPNLATGGALPDFRENLAVP